MMTKTLKPTAGRLLISEPTLQDFYFRKSVVLLAEHNEEGSFGLIINKPVNIKLHEIIRGFPDFDARVFLGGPVKTDSLFYLHTRADLIEDSMKIIDGLYWGGEIKQVKTLIFNNELESKDIRFFIGYSGWASKQLEHEMELNSWIVSKTNLGQVISEHPEDLWPEILKNLGGDYALWANYPPDPSLN